MGKKVVYAIYKEDQFIDLGTKEELAEKLNVKPKHIMRLATPSTQKLIDNRQFKRAGRMIAIRIGKVGDELEESRDTTKTSKSK